MNTRLACITTFALALGACDKPSETDAELGSEETEETGDGDGDNNEASGGSCGEETETILDDLTVTPTGFDSTVEDLLAALQGNFVGTFSWAPADGPWAATHAGTESPLTAAVAYSGGTVRLIEVENAGQPPDDGFEGSLCSNYLVIDVVLEFATEDGVFAESMTVPVTIPGPDAGTNASIYQSLDLDAMMGTLAIDDFMVDEGDVITDLVLLGEVTDAALLGELALEVTSGDGPDGTVGFGLIADYDAPRVP